MTMNMTCPKQIEQVKLNFTSFYQIQSSLFPKFGIPQLATCDTLGRLLVPHSIATAPVTLPAMFNLVWYHWSSLSELLHDPSAPVHFYSFFAYIWENASKRVSNAATAHRCNCSCSLAAQTNKLAISINTICGLFVVAHRIPA